MSPFRKFFDSLTRPSVRGSKSTRRRRRRQDAKLRGGEQLEAKQLLAVTSLADIPTQDLAGEPAALKLSTYFDENTVSGTVVKFETSASTPLPTDQKDFFVELTDNTPTTKQNFLSYVNDGSYDGTMIHRSIDSFIVEGGAYTAPLVDANLSGSTPGIVQPKGAIVNEPGNSNVRGTISMSRLSGVTNSASNRFYFNINDNSALLDGVDGGDTAFGNVLGSGMAVLDVMNNALTYSGDSYYAELGEAAKDLEFLPIWNLDGDGIIKPADFLKFDSVAQVSEDALMSFAISFDGQPTSSKVTSQIVNGELVLTPVDGQTGTVNVTVSVSSTIDAGASALVKTFAVNVGEVEPIQIPLYRDRSGKIYAAGTQVSISAGVSLRTDSLGIDYTVIAAVDLSTNGGKQVLIRQQSTGDLITWQCDEDWVRSSNLPKILGSDTSGIQDKAALFSVDLDAFTGLTRFVPVETTGTQLVYDSQNVLYANGYAISISVGANLKSDSLGSDYRVLAAEDFGEASGGKQVLIKQSNGDLVTWQCDDSWVRSGNLPKVLSDDSAGQAGKASDFGVSLDEPAPDILPLYRDSSQLVYAAGISVSIVAETPLRTNSLGSDYEILAAADLGFNGRKQVLIRQQSTGDLITWQCDEDWVRSSNLPKILGSDTSGIQDKAALFGVDLNAFTGLTRFVPVETTGTQLVYDSQNVLYANGYAISISVGANLKSDSLGSDYRVLAAEDFGEASGGKQVLIKQSNGDLVTWQCDDSWVRSGNLPKVLSDDSAGQAGKASDFGVSLDEPAPDILPLYRDSSQLVYAAGISVSIVAESPLLTNSLGSDYEILAAADLGFNGRKQVLIRQQSTGDLITWQCDEDWVRSSNLPKILGSDTSGIQDKAALFGVDLNAFTGLMSLAPVETTGTQLVYDSQNVLYANGYAISISVGAYLKINSLGDDYQILAAEDFGEIGEGKQVLIKQSNGDLITWQCDDSWVRSGNLPKVLASDSTGIAEKALMFSVTISG